RGLFVLLQRRGPGLFVLLPRRGPGLFVLLQRRGPGLFVLLQRRGRGLFVLLQRRGRGLFVLLQRRGREQVSRRPVQIKPGGSRSDRLPFGDFATIAEGAFEKPHLIRAGTGGAQHGKRDLHGRFLSVSTHSHTRSTKPRGAKGWGNAGVRRAQS